MALFSRKCPVCKRPASELRAGKYYCLMHANRGDEKLIKDIWGDNKKKSK